MNDLWEKELPQDSEQTWEENNWKWISGSQTPNQLASSSEPSSRYSSACFVLNDALFLYGGFGYGNSADSTGTLNSLWMFEFGVGFSRTRGDDTLDQPSNDAPVSIGIL